MAALVILDVLKNPVPDEYESPNVTTMPLYVAVSQPQGCHRIGEHQQHGWLGNHMANRDQNASKTRARLEPKWQQEAISTPWDYAGPPLVTLNNKEQEQHTNSN